MLTIDDFALKLAQSQKLEALGKLASGIAHEINTPSHFIGMNLNFLGGAVDDLLNLIDHFHKFKNAAGKHEDMAGLADEIDTLCDAIGYGELTVEVREAIEQSRAGVEQISRIVKAMKEFSHPGSREFVHANLNRVLENAMMVSRGEWKGVADVDTSFDETLPVVPCLAGELNQVFLNLIVNAAHAVADDKDRTGPGRIGIVTGIEGTNAVIHIEDNGGGIEDGIRDHVFDPFFTTKEVGRGTGQGLAIAHDIIVNKHGGEIGFESDVAMGTQFIIRLPLRQR